VIPDEQRGASAGVFNTTYPWIADYQLTAASSSRYSPTQVSAFGVDKDQGIICRVRISYTYKKTNTYNSTED